MKKYLVVLRDDRGNVRNIKAVIESEQTIGELLQHIHIVEVVAEVEFPRAIGKLGFVEVSEEEAVKLLEKEEKIRVPGGNTNKIK